MFTSGLPARVVEHRAVCRFRRQDVSWSWRRTGALTVQHWLNMLPESLADTLWAVCGLDLSDLEVSSPRSFERG